MQQFSKLYDYAPDLLALVDNKVSIADIDFSDELTLFVGDIAEDLKANRCIVSQDWFDNGFRYCVKIQIVVEDTIASDEEEYYYSFSEELQIAKERFYHFCKDKDINEFGWDDIQRINTNDIVSEKTSVPTVLEYSFHCMHNEI